MRKSEEMKLNDFLIQCDCTIKETMMQIDKNAKGIVYIVQKEEIIGVITDGDIRRFLLKGGDLEEKVVLIMNKNPIMLDIEQEKEVYSLMEQYHIRSVPVVNKYRNILKIYFRSLTLSGFAF